MNNFPRCVVPFIAIVSCVFGVRAGVNPLFAAEGEADGVSGTVFLDKNANGVRDAGEPGFSGIGVMLFGHDAKDGLLYLTTATDSQGHYFFPASRIGLGSTFTVTTGGAPLLAAAPTKYAPRHAYYVATMGNDSNPGSRQRPLRSLAKAVKRLNPGDVLYIREGEYREYVSPYNRPLPGGMDWDQPVVVAGMPGETVVIKPPTGKAADLLVNLTYPQQRYIILDNLVFDAEDVTAPMKIQSLDGSKPPPCHIRVINCELMHSNGSGVFMVGEDDQFINCRIHNNGHSKKAHGLYVGSQHSLIQGCDIYGNSGWGIHLYNGSAPTAANNVIRGNRVHDNDRSGQGCPPIGLHTGAKNLVYDNIIWGNCHGLAVTIGGRENSIVNNTIYGMTAGAINIASDGGSPDNIVRNNITISRAGGQQLNYDRKSNTVDHNMTSGDPMFRDVDGLDFHLLPKSPAIDAGAEAPEVRTDFDGVARPQGKGYDLGAYEYSAEAYVPTNRQHAAVYAGGRKTGIDIGFARKPK